MVGLVEVERPRTTVDPAIKCEPCPAILRAHANRSRQFNRRSCCLGSLVDAGGPLVRKTDWPLAVLARKRPGLFRKRFWRERTWDGHIR